MVFRTQENKFIDQILKKINEETLRLLEFKKIYGKIFNEDTKLFILKVISLEISQRAFDHLWRVCESYEMWCKETKQ